MGMTIDTSIEKLIHEKRCFIDEGWDDTGELEAYDMAINTMRKYQKVQELVKFGNANELGFEYIGEKITEVIEDGK